MSNWMKWGNMIFKDGAQKGRKLVVLGLERYSMKIKERPESMKGSTVSFGMFKAVANRNYEKG